MHNMYMYNMYMYIYMCMYMCIEPAMSPLPAAGTCTSHSARVHQGTECMHIGGCMHGGSLTR